MRLSDEVPLEIKRQLRRKAGNHQTSSFLSSFIISYFYCIYCVLEQVAILSGFQRRLQLPSFLRLFEEGAREGHSLVDREEAHSCVSFLGETLTRRAVAARILGQRWVGSVAAPIFLTTQDLTVGPYLETGSLQMTPREGSEGRSSWVRGALRPMTVS